MLLVNCKKVCDRAEKVETLYIVNLNIRKVHQKAFPMTKGVKKQACNKQIDNTVQIDRRLMYFVATPAV